MDIESILRETRSVAIVGVSADPMRPSHGVWQYLKSASDYTLYLVNPTVSEIDGTPVYPSLADLPVVPDLVDVFRRREHLLVRARATRSRSARKRFGCNRVCGTTRLPATVRRPVCRS